MLRSDLKVIAELIPKQAKVLDLGCADGALLEYLVREKQVRGSGIELSEAGVMACVKRGLSVRQGKIEEGLADYPNQSLDVVILSQTLPFLSHPAVILQEMLRVGQQAIVSFPNWGYWRCRLEMAFNGRIPQAPAFEQRWDSEKRWQIFTLADFEDLCHWHDIELQERVFLNGNWRIEQRENLFARTAVYALKQTPHAKIKIDPDKS